MSEQTLGKSAIDAATTGALFVGIDYAINKVPLTKELAMKGAVSAGSELVSSTVSGVLLPMIPGIATGAAYLNSLVSAGIYVAASSALKTDSRGWMEKFFHQAGASFASMYPSTMLYMVAMGR